MADVGLYTLSDGSALSSRNAYTSPQNEYLAAFEDGDEPFLFFYRVDDGRIEREAFSRGVFLEIARQGVSCLLRHGLTKGDRVAHFFSDNSPQDLIFRLAESLIGAVPVTINWQADNEERMIYKVRASRAKLILYDEGFSKAVEGMRPAFDAIPVQPVSTINNAEPAVIGDLPPLDYEDEKGIIFTSGTTGHPKGVMLSHRSYLANRFIFEDYFQLSPADSLELLLVNPLHHTNSSALTDWGMRRRGAVIHLVQRYTTLFWRILAEAHRHKRCMLVTSLVPRHFDFLETLQKEGKLPLDEAMLAAALLGTEILVGSAPVGPTTIKNALSISKRLPHVRFGSTETCLQVMAIPLDLPHNETMAAFEAGWNHRWQGAQAPGYYIGREHFPFTRVRVVRAIDPDNDGFMQTCEYGEPGYLVTQGANVMTGYVDQEEETRAVIRDGWYTGLRDRGFALPAANGQLDFYWMGRDSALLIRGGANYAYEQVAADLSQVLIEEFRLPPEQFKLAVVGLTIGSEHEDSCCVTLELNDEVSERKEELARDFIAKAAQRVPKGCRPDVIRFGEIPCSFKGAILYPELKEEFRKYLASSERRES